MENKITNKTTLCSFLMSVAVLCWVIIGHRTGNYFSSESLSLAGALFGISAMVFTSEFKSITQNISDKQGNAYFTKCFIGTAIVFLILSQATLSFAIIVLLFVSLCAILSNSLHTFLRTNLFLGIIILSAYSVVHTRNILEVTPFLNLLLAISLVYTVFYTYFHNKIASNPKSKQYALIYGGI